MSRRATIPMIVVNQPIGFDLVQPVSIIMVINDKIPNKNAAKPMRRGIIKSLAFTSEGYPGVVAMKILFIAKIATMNELEATMAAFIILLASFPFRFDTRKLATAVIENPPNSELITIN